MKKLILVLFCLSIALSSDAFSAKWSLVIPISNSISQKESDVAIDANGIAYLAYPVSNNNLSPGIQIVNIIEKNPFSLFSIPTKFDPSLPNIAVDRLGNGIVTWIEPENENRTIFSCKAAFFSKERAPEPKILSNPMRMSPDITADPCVAIKSFGNGLVLWYQKALHRSISGRLYNSIEFSSLVNGVWNEAKTLFHTINPLSHPQMAQNENGEAIALWIDLKNAWLYTAIWSQGKWQIPHLPEKSILIGKDAPKPAIAINKQGNGVVIWVDSDHFIKAAHFKKGALEKIHTFSQDTSVTKLTAAINDKGEVLTLWGVKETLSAQEEISCSSYKNGSWSEPRALFNQTSKKGQLNNLQVAFNDQGNALAIWSKEEGFGKIATLFGAVFCEKWSHPVPITAFPQNASLHFAVKSRSCAITWREKNALKAIMGEYVFGPEVPRNFTGRRIMDISPPRIYYANLLSWENVDPSVIQYHLYRNQKLIAVIPAKNSLHKYTDHTRKKDKSDTYELRALDSALVESSAASLTLP